MAPLLWQRGLQRSGDPVSLGPLVTHFPLMARDLQGSGVAPCLAEELAGSPPGACDGAASGAFAWRVGSLPTPGLAGAGTL